MARVILFGAGRGADVAARYLAADSEHEVCAFTVESQYLRAETFRGLPVVDFAEVQEQYSPEAYSMFVPLGFQQMNSLRAERYLEAKRKGYSCISYVSSKVATHDTLKVGENCFVLENQSINFDVTIGDDVVIWSGCQLGDESVIGDHAWLSSHAVLAGQVRIGDYAFLGVNSTISNGVHVGPRTYVGASALITRDTLEGSVYVVEASKPLGIASDAFLRMTGLEHAPTVG